MIKRFFISLLCLILFSGPVISVAAATDNSRIVRVGVYDNAPKIFTDTSGNASGFWPDIMGYIASQEGWKIQYIQGTWSECLQRLENNEIDVMPDVAYTEARAQIYDFPTQSAYTSWSQVFTRKGSSIQSVLDFEGKKIAVLQGSVNVEGPNGIKQLVQAFNVNCTFIETDSYKKVFELVQKGEADGGVTSKDFGYQHMADYNLIETPIIFQPSNLYFAFSKNASLTPYLIDRIDYQLKTIKDNKNSIYYQSLEKWFSGTSIKTVREYVMPLWAISALAAFGWCTLVLAVIFIILELRLKKRTKELTREIYERRQAEEAIRQSEAKYANLVEQSNDGIIIVQNGRMVFVNRKMIELTGYSLEEVIEKPFVDFLTPKYKPLVADRNRRRMLGEAVPYRYDAEIATSKGTVVAVDINAGIIEYMGQPATMAVIRDMTEQNRMWTALRDRENRLSLIYDNVSDVIFGIDAEPNDNFRFKSVNRRFLGVTGLSENQILGKLVQEIIPEPGLALAIGKYKEAIKTGHSVHWEEISQYPTGTKYGEVSLAPVPDANGNYTQLIGTVHDITERKHTDEELRQVPAAPGNTGRGKDKRAESKKRRAVSSQHPPAGNGPPEIRISGQHEP